MAASHVVTAPLVIAKKDDNSDLYLYEGAELPDFIKADEVKRLVDLGLVDKTDGSKSKKPAAESN